MSSLCDCQLTGTTRVICDSHQIAFTELLEQTNSENISRGIDALSQMALGIAGMTAVEVQDVPRMIVQTACRGVEKMIELYDRKSRDGRLSMEEQGALKIAIRAAATDLERALTEGVQTAQQILSSLDAQPRVSPD